ALQTAIAWAREQIAAIKAQTHTYWANTFDKRTDSNERVGRSGSVGSNRNSVVDTPELRAVYNELMSEITIFFTEIGQALELYHRFKIIKNSAEFDTLSPAQQTKLNHELRDFVLNGAELQPDQQTALAPLQPKGAQLCAKFAP
ncbi:M3 family metallopeptidase, partial [Neisseria sp. P0021.S007]